jgi:hypothetical protein
MYIHGNKSQSPAWVSQLLVQPTALASQRPQPEFHLTL